MKPTRRKLTVLLAMWTAAPTGRMRTAATRSLEMAVDGLTPKRRISIGVMSAPPPAPVMPTSRPTTALPITMYGSMDMAGSVQAGESSPGGLRPPYFYVRPITSGI